MNQTVSREDLGLEVVGVTIVFVSGVAKVGLRWAPWALVRSWWLHPVREFQFDSE